MPFAQRLKATLKNKYFIVLTLTMIAVALYQNVNGTVATYYAQYMLGNVEVMGVMQSFENIPKIIAIICLAPFIKKFGKRNLVLFGAVLCVLGQVVCPVCTAEYDHGYGRCCYAWYRRSPVLRLHLHHAG